MRKKVILLLVLLSLFCVLILIFVGKPDTDASPGSASYYFSEFLEKAQLAIPFKLAESLGLESNPTVQETSQRIEEEDRLRPEIRNYPYNITDAEEEKLKLKEQTEESLEKELEEMQEASKDEGGA